MISKVVIHTCHGDIIKGETSDFFPNKDVFHLSNQDTAAMEKINIKDLKAIYFVKDLSGDSTYNEKK